jgi:hypothetical protein
VHPHGDRDRSGIDGRRPRRPEIAGFRQVGLRWDGRLGATGVDARRRSLRACNRFPRPPAAGRNGRSGTVDFVACGDAGEVVATSHAGALPSGLGAWLSCVGGCCSALRWPGASSYTREPKTLALAVLSSDALSSVAMGARRCRPSCRSPAAARSDSRFRSRSRRRGHGRCRVLLPPTHPRLPNGGGSHAVAHENLGELPALIAAVS